MLRTVVVAEKFMMAIFSHRQQIMLFMFYVGLHVHPKFTNDLLKTFYT